MQQGTSIYSGTSQAAPFVTGIAALIMSVNSSLSPVQIKSILKSNVDINNNLQGKCSTSGRVNAFKSVLAATGYVLGDVDMDGSITASDARLALRCATDLEVLTQFQLVLADIDGNGQVDANDARQISRWAVGLD